MTTWIVGAVLALAAAASIPLLRANLRHGHHEAPRLPPVTVGEGDPRFGSMTLTEEMVVHHELPVSPAGYLRGLDSVFGHVTTTSLPPADPEDYDPEADEPWRWLPAPPPSEAEVAASRAAHGYIPELDPGPGSPGQAQRDRPGPDQLTIRDDWMMPTDADIACRACVQVDDGWACQVDLGGRCPSDPDNYVPPADLGPRAGAVLARYEQRLGARKGALA